MSINLSCEKCGKLYEMPDSVAGKRARCKQCGHEFRIPMKGASSQVRSAQSADDPYELQEAPAPSRSRSYREEDDDVAPPPRASYKPARTKSKSSRREEVDQDGFRRGLWFLFFGVGIFVLPFFGIQFKIVSFMGELAQIGIGVVCLGIGSIMVIKSGGHVFFGVAGLCATGFGALIFVGAIVVHNKGLVPGQGQPQNVANHGQPPPGQPGPGQQSGARRKSGPPLPGQEPAPGFPLGGDQPGASASAGFPPGSPPPGMPGGNVKAVLSNARLTRGGNFGGRQLSLSVDYRFENGSVTFGRPCVLMLESAGSNIKVVIHRLEAQGTITAEITPFGPTAPTSFEAYLAVETIGPGGMQPHAISDKISVAVSGAQPGATNPTGMPPGGPPRFPRMPRPGFGPPGR